MKSIVVRSNAEIPNFELPGLRHQTLAGAAQGLRGVEVWDQELEPGAATPLHRHDCEEVIVVLSGAGLCEAEDRACDFTAPATLIVPPGALHRIVNTGPVRMRVIAALTMAPVAVTTADGAPLPLPWGS